MRKRGLASFSIRQATFVAPLFPFKHAILNKLILRFGPKEPRVTKFTPICNIS